MSSLKSFIIECGYLNVFVAVGPVPVRIALPSLSLPLPPFSLSVSLSLSLSLRKNRKKGGFFSPLRAPSRSQAPSCLFCISPRIQDISDGKNTNLAVSFEITCLVFSFHRGSSGGLGLGWRRNNRGRVLRSSSHLI